MLNAKRFAKIRELERQLEELKANATEVKGDPPRREEVDSSPDESGFPRYSNPVDTGLRGSGFRNSNNDWGEKSTPPFPPTLRQIDVSRVLVDGVKRSSSEAIRLSLFSFSNLLDSVGLKHVCKG